MPLEERLCSYPLDRLKGSSGVVSLWEVVHCHVLIVSNEVQHWLDWYVQLSGCDLLFPDWILAYPLLHCFDSGSSPQTFRLSLLSLSFNPPEFLIMFNCPIDERIMTSMFLRVWKFENRVFHNCEDQLQKHGFPGHHSILTLWQTRANCLGTSTWSDRSQKTANLTNVSSNCLQLRTTYGRTM